VTSRDDGRQWTLAELEMVEERMRCCVSLAVVLTPEGRRSGADISTSLQASEKEVDAVKVL